MLPNNIKAQCIPQKAAVYSTYCSQFQAYGIVNQSNVLQTVRHSFLTNYRFLTRWVNFINSMQDLFDISVILKS